MSPSVSLRAVVDEMEMLGEGMHVFLNRHTGELLGGTDEQLAKADGCDDDELLDWEADIIPPLRQAVESPEWLELPHRDAPEDHRVMERFALAHCQGRVREELLSALQGRGAFRRFRDAIHRHGLRNAWFGFRREALAEDARAWLEAEGVAFGP